MPVEIADVIFGPVRTRFGHLHRRRDKWILHRLRLIGDYFHVCALRQLRLGRQDYHAVSNSAFVRHVDELTSNGGQSKPANADTVTRLGVRPRLAAAKTEAARVATKDCHTALTGTLDAQPLG